MEAKKVRDSRLDTLSIVAMFYTVITGISFIFLNGEQVENESTYHLMTDLASIKVWGMMFLLNGVFHLLAIIVEYRRWQYIFFVIAGITGFSLFLLYAIASFDTNTYKINAFRYLLFAGVNLTIAIKGAIAWRQEKKIL